MSTATAPAITAEQLAALVLGRSTAIMVQDPTGDVHPLDYLSTVQQDDPDTVVLIDREGATAILADAAARLTAELRDAGVLL